MYMKLSFMTSICVAVSVCPVAPVLNAPESSVQHLDVMERATEPDNTWPTAASLVVLLLPTTGENIRMSRTLNLPGEFKKNYRIDPNIRQGFFPKILV